MKKLVIIILTFLFVLTSCSNSEDKKKIEELESKISNLEKNIEGTYSIGKNIEKGRIGTLLIHKSNDNKYYYRIDVNKGTPSYNSGVHEGEIFINGKKGTNNNLSCFIEFNFGKEYIDIKNTFENKCGFGGGVVINGIYNKKNLENPEGYTDRIGKQQYFKNLY